LSSVLMTFVILFLRLDVAFELAKWGKYGKKMEVEAKR
jgi:hypothetical protein